METRTNIHGAEVISYTTKETAAFIREALKQTFPGVKFSVRTSYASMTSSTHVGWTDGPTEAEVERVTGRFTSQGFDGMTDSTTYHDQSVNGQRVRYSGWVTVKRTMSPALLEKALTRFQFKRQEYGQPPAALTVVPDGSYAYVDGPDRYTDTGMCGREYSYGCGSAVQAIAATMRPNGIRIIEMKGGE